jgi:hypothetical protein
MQFQVPQNITMEDRIVGSLTAIQFGILVLGGGFSFFVFSSLTIPSPINRGLGLLMGAATIILALGKFNDQPLYRFGKFIITFITTPKIRVWHKSTHEAPLVKPNPYHPQMESVHAVKNISKEDIARLAVVLDSRGTEGVSPTIHTLPPKQAPTK